MRLLEEVKSEVIITKLEIFRWIKIEKHSVPNKVATDTFVERLRSTDGFISELAC